MNRKGQHASLATLIDPPLAMALQKLRAHAHWSHVSHVRSPRSSRAWPWDYFWRQHQRESNFNGSNYLERQITSHNVKLRNQSSNQKQKFTLFLGLIQEENVIREEIWYYFVVSDFSLILWKSRKLWVTIEHDNSFMQIVDLECMSPFWSFLHKVGNVDRSDIVLIQFKYYYSLSVLFF